ncbi:MAG: complex I subunit 4 family protein, partial [Candidatus Kryptoniota bacterium]
MISAHLLTLLIFTPLAGAVLLLFFRNETVVKSTAILFSAIDTFLAIYAYISFSTTGNQFQFVEKIPWITSLDISYHLGIDGISLLLVSLTTLLTLISLVASWNSIQKRVKAFNFFVLLLETGMIGVFSSLDLFLFYIFWEAMLIPMYFIIGIWGHERRVYAAIKFFIYTMFGSLLMLV